MAAELFSANDFAHYSLEKLQDLAGRLRATAPKAPILPAVEQAIRIKTGFAMPHKGDD